MEKRIKKSFICAGVDYYTIDRSLAQTRRPKMGDVGLFRVIEASRKYLKSPDASNQYLYSDDLILAAFGNRYATNQCEGYVPEQPVRYCHLLSRGGVAGCIKTMQSSYEGREIELEFLGYALNKEKKIINTVQEKELLDFDPDQISAKIILSVGSSMDSGKTTTAAYLCGGLQQAGKTTAYIKLTGTAFPKDVQVVYDRGAAYATDFSSLGFPSTFLCDKKTLLKIYQTLVTDVLERSGAEYIVMEIADGLLQRETQMLLKDKAFMSTIHSVILSCGDSLGVLSGIELLQAWNIKPFAVAGLFTSSPMLVEETAQKIDLPIFTLPELLSPHPLNYLEPTGMKGKVSYPMNAVA